MSVAITDPSRVAAAAPIRTSAASTNTGTGTVTPGEVLDPTNAALLTTVDIEFTSATTYSVNGAGSFTYTPGSAIDVNGWRVQVNGAPAVGDRFTVRSNAGATGDNRNAFALADALRANVLDGGTKSASRSRRTTHRRRGTLHAYRAGQSRCRSRRSTTAISPRRTRCRASTSMRRRPTCCGISRLRRRGADHFRGATRCSTR